MTLIMTARESAALLRALERVARGEPTGLGAARHGRAGHGRRGLAWQGNE